MMRAMWVGLSVVLTLGLGYFVTRGATSGPALQMSTQRLDLGHGKPNQLLTGTFELRNSGSAPLSFSITTSCGCTAASPREGVIAPRQSVPLSVSVTLPAYSKSEKQIQVVVTTNDPKHSQTRCSVVAQVPAPFDVVPERIDFGHVEKKAVAQLASSLKAQLRPADVGQKLVCRVIGYGFTASVAGEGGIQVTPSPLLEYGDHYATLELSIAGREDEIVRVPLHVRLDHPFMTVPASFVWRPGDTQQNRTLEFIAVSSSASLPLGTLESRTANLNCRLERTGVIDARRHRYRIQVDGDFPAPSEQSIIVEDSATGNRSVVKLLVM